MVTHFESVMLFLQLVNLLRGRSYSLAWVSGYSASFFQVRDARFCILSSSCLYFVMFYIFGACVVFRMKWVCIGCCFGWISSFACVEQWGRTANFVQASSSRLGESSRSSPRGFARAPAQAGKLSFERKTISLRRDGLA